MKGSVSCLSAVGIKPNAEFVSMSKCGSVSTHLNHLCFQNDWRVSLSLVQTEKAEDEQLSSALIQAVQKPLRKLFSVLSWQNTLEKV